MGTLTETVPSRAVRARRGNRGLATALHLDLAYLLGDGAMQSFASVLLAPVFSIMFNGGRSSTASVSGWASSWRCSRPP